jgi:demethylmenaquinone methyltransferase/2-methoxy-6-polyprenyl-1,4-benzoquinol methylase
VTGRFVLKIGDHLENAEKKKYYNERAFSEIAPRYDFITRVLSFRRDAAWKRTLVSLLPSYESPVCVDLACGTGDIAFLLVGKYPRGRVAGLDITEPMLDIARHRNTHPNVSFVNQDMGSLAIVSESVDIVTGGYALRNAPDLRTAIDEISRVLKPRGVAAFLDFSKPGQISRRRCGSWRLRCLWTRKRACQRFSFNDTWASITVPRGIWPTGSGRPCWMPMGPKLTYSKLLEQNAFMPFVRP